jgi:1-aminocyclopropane-1-carboxylate deaminase/D-cysteine desulfhydrase-like pyridoxal-dependent ACC family enzyme
MQTAAAARRFGIEPVLVLFKTYELPPGYDGNLLLDYILDADIRIRDAEKGKVVKSSEAFGVLEEVAEDIRGRGLKPYLVSVGGSRVMGDMDKPLGAIGYAEAYTEMLGQARAEGIEPDWVVHSTGSGGTQAGLLVAAKALTEKCRVVGISVSDPKGPFSEDVLEISRSASDTLELGFDIESEDVLVLDEYIGEGYGIVDREVSEVVRLVFQKEGIVLDPVYTAKAMIGLIDMIRKGEIGRSDTVVFFHTGGTPALFPNRDKIVTFLQGETQSVK